MATREDIEKQRLRQYLNSAIKGPKVDAVLQALATGGLASLIQNIEAINDSIYIVKAQGRDLDTILAGRGLVRPESVGLSDDVFRQIGIEVTSRKQVRDLILTVLEIMYGEEFTRATSPSPILEPYQLADGDTLRIQFDDQDMVEVVFSASQFASISAATAQEVSDAITKDLRILGKRGEAFVKNDGAGNYVTLLSQTIGPASSIKVVGGKAQNQLKFSSIRPTSGDATTQWTLTQVAGGTIRATWTGGADPSVGKVFINDYVNIYGTSFNVANRGTFTVSNVQGGLVNNAFVEFSNPNGVAEVVIQGTAQAVLFFNPRKITLSNKQTFAAAYQTESRILEVFVPAMTKVVRRDRIGSAHVHDTGASTVDSLGPYIFDPTKPYKISSEECSTTQSIDANTGTIIQVNNSTPFPDQQGSLIFGFGTSLEEGPVPYIARPSSNSLMINPTYRFKYPHPSGTNISLVTKNSVYSPDANGDDYAFYITDVVSGRIYAQSLIQLVVATGISLVITVLYPNDIGLGKWGTANSEKTYVFGPDPV